MAIPDCMVIAESHRYNDGMTERGDRIRDARLAARLSQEELAARVGVTQSLISHWERGVRSLSADQLRDVAQSLGVSVAYLLFGSALTEQQGNSNLMGTEGAVPMVSIDDAVSRRTPAPDAVRIAPSFPCGASAYAILLPDDSNGPMYPRGSRSLFDPDEKPQPGAMVLAVHGERAEPIIGVLSYATSSHGKVTVITPLNEKWAAARSDQGMIEIIAVMTENTRIVPR